MKTFVILILFALWSILYTGYVFVCLPQCQFAQILPALHMYLNSKMTNFKK